MTNPLYQPYYHAQQQRLNNSAQRYLRPAPIGKDFTSNDYLGLAANTELYQEFLRQQSQTAIRASSSGSRLLGGSATIAHQLENLLEQHYQRPALYMNSGYHANLAILPALLNKQDLILADKHIHASLIDGARLSQATLIRYPHQNLEALEQLLIKHRANYQQTIIVSEALFSMDGSLSDLQQLVKLKSTYQTLLYIDEAHSIGLYGQHGLGLANAYQLQQDIDIWVAPCAKALAAIGAIVLVPDILKDHLINHARPLIYSSNQPPINIAWLIHQIEHLPQYHPQRHQLFNNIRYLRTRLNLPNAENQLSPILPYPIGDNARTLQLAQHLQQSGISVAAIRPPTVAPKHAQLRISLSAAHTNQDLDHLAECLQHPL